MPNQNYTLFSGGAQGAENQFGKLAEYHGLSEVNYTFEGHRIERTRGVRVLTDEELTQKDVSLTYVSKLLNRKFTNAEKMRKVLQTIMWQVDASQQIFVVGTILDDGTVKGGTGWGAEFAKICNKELFVFDQAKDVWSSWEHGAWVAVDAPAITAVHFTGTGTRFLEDNGKKALEDLFSRSF